MADELCRFRTKDGAIVERACSIGDGPLDDAGTTSKMRSFGYTENLGPVGAGGAEEDAPRARNLEFIGFLPTGEAVYQNLDPQSEIGLIGGRTGGVGFYIQRPDGDFTRATSQQATQINALLNPPRRTGVGGTSTPFTFDRIPGVGIVATDRRSGQVTLAFPEPQAPPDLQLEVDPQTGNLLTINPTTGKVTDTGQRVGIPELTPQQRRAQELEDFRLQSQQRAQEAEATRGFTASQSALDRAQRAAEFAAQQQLAQQAESRAQQAEARALQSQRLQAAAQLADLVSLTDPAALQAFAAGGGFNISNAIAGGGDALSNAALLPAAQTLRAIEGFSAAPAASPAPAVDPGTQWASFGEPGPDLTLVPGTPRWAEAVERARQQIMGVTGRGGSIGGSQFFAGTDQETPFAEAQRGLVGAGSVAPGAYGGVVGFNSPASYINYANSSGFVNQNPLQALLAAQQARDRGDVNFVAAQHGFSGTVDEPTVFLAGENGPENVQVDPLDQPFIDRIRALRQKVKVPDLIAGGPFNVGFSRLPPTLQQRFFAARQSRYGIPIADQLAEAQRYMLAGAGRGFDFGF